MARVLAIVALAAVFGAAAAAPAFVSIGDWGGAALEDYHRTDELAVAKQFGVSAADLDAEFVVNVGDNMYYYGVWNTSDPQWDTDFENVYTQDSLMVKWYSVLGNHDYGFNPEAQLQYVSPNHDRWVMDARYYTKRVLVGGTQYITFFFLDTNPCVSAYRADDPSGWDPCGSDYPSPPTCKFHQNILAQSCTAQMTWLQSAVKNIPAGDWIMGVGHHVANEIDVEDLIGVLQGAGMDLWFNGHAHTLTHYHLDGKGAYITTGAGCMVKIDSSENEVVHQHRPLAQNSHTKEVVWTQKVAGFTTHQFSTDMQSLTTNYVTYSGDVVHTFTIKRGQPSTDDDPKHDDDSGGDSCKINGCKYKYGAKCQCNYYCTKYNDCCSDYKTVCDSRHYGSLRNVGM